MYTTKTVGVQSSSSVADGLAGGSWSAGRRLQIFPTSLLAHVFDMTEVGVSEREKTVWTVPTGSQRVVGRSALPSFDVDIPV